MGVDVAERNYEHKARRSWHVRGEHTREVAELDVPGAGVLDVVEVVPVVVRLTLGLAKLGLVALTLLDAACGLSVPNSSDWSGAH